MLDLLGQTVRAWHDVGHRGPAVAVCSLQDGPELWSRRCAPPRLPEAALRLLLGTPAGALGLLYGPRAL